MKSIITIIIALSLIGTASAEEGYLVSCDIGMSSKGKVVYIGTYRTPSGKVFKSASESYCPMSAEGY